MKKPLIAISAFFAIASEAELKEKKLLRGDIRNFLATIEKTIVFGWLVIGIPGKHYSIEIQGEEISSQFKSQIESGLNVCFHEIKNLTGLAKCVALISHSRRSYCEQGALSLLNQAYAEIETLKNLENTHFISDIFFDLGLAFYSKNLHEQALISINRSIEIDSENSNYYYLKSRIVNNLEGYEEALFSINKAIKIDSENSNYYAINSQSVKSLKGDKKSIEIESENSDYYFVKSKILENLERYEEALASINKAIEIDPVNSEYYSNQSSFLNCLRRYNDSLISDEQTIKIASKNYSGYSNKGLTLSLIGEDYPAAINSCDLAIQLGGNKPILLVNKGIVLSRAGEYSQAMKLFDGVIREHPENEEGYYGKACCYARQGDTEQAMAALQRAIQIAPRRCCVEARWNPDFDSLRNDQQFISLVGESPSRDLSSIDVDRT